MSTPIAGILLRWEFETIDVPKSCHNGPELLQFLAPSVLAKSASKDGARREFPSGSFLVL